MMLRALKRVVCVRYVIMHNKEKGDNMIELGISTFGETTIIEDKNEITSHDQRIRELVEEIELADRLGLDIFAIGEHHRKDFAVSAPEIVLASGATNTKHIKLSSATTNLSTNDPIRVYQNFSTLDALSNGRAEVMVGRSSFIEGFELFGYSLNNYETLFDEKLAMLLEIRDHEILTWKGNHTHSVNGMGVYPRTAKKRLSVWVASGGNLESSVKIAKLGLPIAYAIIGGNPLAFKERVEIYKKIGYASGFSDQELKVAMHSWGYVARDNDEAIKDYFHPTKTLVDAISKDRAHWRPLTKEQYLAEIESGSLSVGSPKVVANKIIRVMEALKIDRFMLHLPIGSIPREKLLNAIKLFAEEVAPIVRAHFNVKK